MNLRKLYIFILCTTCCFTVFLKAQKLPAEFQNGDGAEQIHLHLDKEVYLPGETIWFKAYMYYHNFPSPLSTNFYAAIYNDDGKLLQQKHYPVFDGTCFGDFTLPDSLSSNTLRIRVVTKGILLSDTTNYYEKTVTVFQKNKNTFRVISTNQKNTLRFFPEGGNVVAEFPNLIAIKALGTNGMPIQINGKIIETSTGNFVDSFFTDNTGLGKITIVPEFGKSYSASWQGTDDIEHITAIIKNAGKGVLFHLETTGNMLYCNILKNDGQSKYDRIKLTAALGNEEILNVSTNMKNKTQWISSVALDSLPDGLLRFTLSDAEDQILQQRLILNTSLVDTHKPRVEILKRDLSSKAENELVLEIPDSMQCNLSISVADLSFYEAENHISIEQDLWLSGDIFPDKEVTKRILLQSSSEKLNLLLLTANTKGIINDQPVFTKALDNYLTVCANYQNKKYPLPEGNNLNLIIKDTIRGKQFFNLIPSNQFEFIRDGLVFFDSAQVNYQLDKDKEKTEFLKISLKERYKPIRLIEKIQFFSRDQIVTSLNNTDKNPILDFENYRPKKFNQEQSLQEVVVKSKYNNPEIKRIQELDNKYTSGMFSGISRGYQFNLVDDKNASMQSDILNYIVYRVPALKICQLNGERFLMNTRGSFNCNIGNAVSAFLDEVELPQQTGLSSLQVSQIAYVKYIPGIVIGSSFVSDKGVLYIYTKRGDDVEPHSDFDMHKIKIGGYDIPKNFIAPDYSITQNRLNADGRTTLYWNPYVITGKENNKIEIRFNNNDISKKLLVTIEGFSAEGKLIHIEKVIENE